jgi:hypothetical protein
MMLTYIVHLINGDSILCRTQDGTSKEESPIFGPLVICRYPATYEYDDYSDRPKETRPKPQYRIYAYEHGYHSPEPDTAMQFRNPRILVPLSSVLFYEDPGSELTETYEQYIKDIKDPKSTLTTYKAHRLPPHNYTD